MTTILNRSSLASGRYLDLFESLPANLRWSSEQIERSLQQTLRVRPVGSDIWLFGYGSLIWNPLINYTQTSRATLPGFSRSFCIETVAGRATPAAPGRMLALEPGGTTQGIVFRLADAMHEHELRLVWYREMPTGAYIPMWQPVRLDNDQSIMALVFIANPDHPQHRIDTSVATVASAILGASGPLGSNSEYVLKLDTALRLHALQDAYVTALAQVLQPDRNSSHADSARSLP
ncbi:gamma-glutamylcyclotransferase [Paraburkholderia sp. BCC1885]|uniref:gamma-glutamylcyclotransferase n=1 Tax=Paraburkholderia sp. BCC1885 TaxID=2562669 RepID=UPI0021B3510F|nr:gamma-glutamylcyclotransferase [Paraburkholderia sp. BCC1885]